MTDHAANRDDDTQRDDRALKAASKHSAQVKLLQQPDQARLWEHWGTTEALRHVAIKATREQDAAAASVALHVGFWSADWTPWGAGAGAGPIALARAALRRASKLRAVTDSALLPPAIAPEADGDGWGDPPPVATGAPVLSAGGFEGPLDWLLDMVRSRRIDLAKLPIAALIGSFADALQTALARSDGSPPVLLRWGDWLVMAAALAQLRSCLLLPVEAPEAKAALCEAEAMRRQLVGRAQIGAVADWLERQPQLGRDMFRRGRPESHPSNHGAEITDLLRACLALLQVPEEPEVYRIRPLPFWGVAQAIERIEALLAARPAGGELDAFVPLWVNR